MKWLRYLEKYNISFNINILNREDSILIDTNNKFMYIIEGFMQRLQVFTNKEILCTQLLYKHHTFQSTKKFCTKGNYTCEFVALTRTIVLTINKKEFMKKGQRTYQFMHSCDYKLMYSKDIIKIISHKNTKKRLIQFLFILTEKLGIFTNNKILIPLNLSHHVIATVVGSQRITINKIMNELKRQRILSYDNQKISIENIIQLIY